MEAEGNERHTREVGEAARMTRNKAQAAKVEANGEISTETRSSLERKIHLLESVKAANDYAMMLIRYMEEMEGTGKNQGRANKGDDTV